MTPKLGFLCLLMAASRAAAGSSSAGAAEEKTVQGLLRLGRRRARVPGRRPGALLGGDRGRGAGYHVSRLPGLDDDQPFSLTQSQTEHRAQRQRLLDDWGPEPLSAEQSRDLLEIVEDRYGRGALLITSQVPVDRWYELIGSPTLADAILDRIVHAAYRIELSGDSLRKHIMPEAGAGRSALTEPAAL